MKVYSIHQVDNEFGFITKRHGTVHKSYRGASKSLIDKGFDVSYEDEDLLFYSEPNELRSCYAVIIESELLD